LRKELAKIVPTAPILELRPRRAGQRIRAEGAVAPLQNPATPCVKRDVLGLAPAS
jgi:hypothetical protein